MGKFAKIRTDLVVSTAEIDGQTVYNIKDPKTGRYFRLREPEYWLARKLDGVTSLAEVAKRFQGRFDLNISEQEVAEFVEQLEKLYFLENTRSEQEISRTSYLVDKKKSLFSRLLFIKIKAFDPTRLLNLLVKLYRPFHNRFWLSFNLFLMLFGLILFAANSSSFDFSLSAVFNIGSIVAIVISLFIIVTLHEFAHAIICRHYGGEVREIGILLLYFQPCFYSNLSDAWLFEKKSHRLAVTAAGPFFQMVLFALAVIAWRVTLPGSFISDVSYIIVLVTFITFLFNFNPLIKLDGYYLLSDWLDIPNLRSKAFGYFGNLFKRKVLGWPIEAFEVTRRERRVFLGYALLALVYSALLIGYVLYLLAAFLIDRMGGVGLVLLVAVLLFTLNKNIAGLLRGFIQHLVYMKNIFKQPLRLLKYVVFLVVFAVAFFGIQFPHRVSGEVSIQPVIEFTLKLNDLGLLEKRLRQGGGQPGSKATFLQMASTDMAVLELIPRVQDGQYVHKGDTVATLTSNQVSNEILAGNSELERLEGQLALLRAPPKKEEIDEAGAQVDAAMTRFEQLAREYKRAKELLEKNLSTPEKLEVALASLQIAQAELANKKARLALLKSPPRPEEESVILADIEKQKARLRFLEEQFEAQIITAPIEGVVSAVESNESLMSIVDSREVEVLVPVSDYDIHLIKLGQNVKLKVRSCPGRAFTGLVVHISKEAVERDGGAYFMVSVVAENREELLYDGMTGYAKIEVGRRSLFSLALRKVTSFVRVEFWSWW